MIEVDAQHFPLLVCRWIGAISGQDFEDHLRKLDAEIARAEQQNTFIAMVVDSTRQGDVSPEARKLMVATRPGYDRLIGSWATMTPIVRLVVTALRWMRSENLRLVHPCSTVPAAFEGAAAALHAKGVMLSPATLEMIDRVARGGQRVSAAGR
jgi:hypothetical protein